MIRSFAAMVCVGASSFMVACGPANGSTGEDVGSAQLAQIPFDLGNPDYAQQITLTMGDAPVVKVVITTNDPLLSGSSYLPRMEYWYTHELPANMVGPVSMGFSYAEYEPADLDTFTAGYAPAFSVPEFDAQWAPWSPESHPSMAGLATYLYAAPDPDDPEGASLGLALGVGPNNLLHSVVWYKSRAPVDGLLWQPEKSPPSSLVWSYVGMTTNPTDILPASNMWHYVEQGP